MFLLFIKFLFWSSLFFLVYHYVLYPVVLFIIQSSSSQHEHEDTRIKSLSPFSIIIPAHNEEACLAEKLESILASEFPEVDYEVLIGSDNSTDKTNEIASLYSDKHEQIKFFPFDERQGKIVLVEKLVAEAQYELLIHTDANVLFEKDCIYQLIQSFTDQTVGVVGANILNTEKAVDGISLPESSYISMENRLKDWEGKWKGTMMGAFGGCFAMRKKLMSNIPEKFIVDDFYLTFCCMEKGYKSIYNLEAICYEDVSNDWQEEFRRKIRIGVGNYQNMLHFKKWIFKPFSAIGFSFISHKVLRWIGWSFIFLLLVSSCILASQSGFYFLVFIGMLASWLAVGLDFLLAKFGIHIKWLRYIFHFYMMNLALAFAFFSYLKGVETNIWTPTKRHQSIKQ